MTQTVEQLEARLANVRLAIDAALTGKSYRINSGGSERELQRQSLKDLQAMEQSLERQISRLQGGSGVRFGVPTV